MEYKRSYAGEVVGIIAIIIGAFIAVVTIQSPPRTGDSYNDRLEQLNSEMKEERLNESPMTIEKAKLMFGSGAIWFGVVWKLPFFRSESRRPQSPSRNCMSC